MYIFACKVTNIKNGSEVSRTSKRITDVDVSFAKCLKDSNSQIFIN